MSHKDFSYIVVGSGLFGAVIAERIASQLQQKVLVIEKRDHIGGNCHSAIDEETGIEYHTYGTHIFHTSEEKVWQYINRFSSFNTYRHQVLSCYKNKIYQLPINLETINSYYNLNLKPFEVDAFLEKITKGEKSNPVNFEEKAISSIGRELYDAFVRGYTVKQWQIDPKALPAEIFSRLPVRKNYNENYYFDEWQGIPLNGYTHIFNNLLGHPNISVLLNTDFFSIKDTFDKDVTIIYSGPIDRYFDYKFGALSWRTLRFERKVFPVKDYQGNAVINYPEEEIPYTRIHEPVHLHPERKYNTDKTVVFEEYSLPDNGANPYYPILTEENIKKLRQYKEYAAGFKNLFICGRLGEYKYYDMDKTISNALNLFETRIKEAKHNQ